MLQHLVALESHLLGELPFRTAGLMLRNRLFEQRPKEHGIHRLENQVESGERCSTALEQLQVAPADKKKHLFLRIAPAAEPAYRDYLAELTGAGGVDFDMHRRAATWNAAREYAYSCTVRCASTGEVFQSPSRGKHSI